MRRCIDAIATALDSTPAQTVLFVLAVAAMGIDARRWHVSVAFYATVAQVIPVLLLVAAVEGRMFRSRRSDTPFDRRVQRAFLMLVGLGEGSALVAVARGHDTLALRIATLLGLIVVVVIFLDLALDGPAAPDDDRRDADDAAA